MSSEFIRQSLILSESEIKYPATVIGCGSLGSIAALGAVKLGVRNLVFIDKDRVGPENLLSQTYQRNQIGQPKVTALKTLLNDYCSVIQTYFGEVTVEDGKTVIQSLKDETRKMDLNSVVEGIVTSSPDSMKTRMDIWNAVKTNSRVRYLMDLRSQFPVLHLYFTDLTSPEDRRFYENSLYKDEEATMGVCGGNSIFDLSLWCGAMATTAIRKMQKDEQFVRKAEIDIETFSVSLTMTNGQEISNSEEIAQFFFERDER